MLTSILRKPIVATLLYTILITLALMLADLAFAYSNEHFIFEITRKEFLNKLFLFVLLVSFVKKRTHRLVVLLFVAVASFVQYTHFEYFGKNIGAIDFYLLHGNTREVIEILSTMLNIIIIPIVIVVTLLSLTYFIDRLFSVHSYKLKYAGYVVVLCFVAISAQVFYVSNIKAEVSSHVGRHSDVKLLYPITNRHSARNFFISANYFLFGILPRKLFQDNGDIPVLESPTLSSVRPNRTILLVIGESLRYDKFTLTNNKLSPNLGKLLNSEKIFTKKVFSGGTMTKVSVATLINRVKGLGGLRQISEENNCLFKLAKENHFDTYFLSAQSTYHLQVIRDLICPKYIDQLIDRNDFKNYIEPTGYDEDLKSLLDKLDILKRNKFIVLQQRGSHSTYKDQYPSAFSRYSDYDNTVLYTDYSLHDLFTYIDSKINHEYFIFYVSDHGELLGENGKKGHGHLSKEVYEVPFIMMTNSKDTEIKKQFEAIRSHYDISNYILSLLGYEADLHGEEDREIMILNADLDGFSGYGTINIRNGVESEIQIKKH